MLPGSVDLKQKSGICVDIICGVAVIKKQPPEWGSLSTIFFIFFKIPTFCLRLSHVLIHKRLAIRYTTILTLAILLILIQLIQKNKIKWSSQAKLPDRDALTPIIYHIYIMGSQNFYRYHTNSISYRDPPVNIRASRSSDTIN